jgi:hypothetical protein
MLRALDTDGDGEISAAEQPNRPAAGLLCLDRNGDGNSPGTSFLGLRRPAWAWARAPCRRALRLHDNPLLPNSTV